MFWINLLSIVCSVVLGSVLISLFVFVLLVLFIFMKVVLVFG